MLSTLKLVPSLGNQNIFVGLKVHRFEMKSLIT